MKAALAQLFRSRLAYRIYLVGLAQMAVVAAGFFVFLELDRGSRESADKRHAEIVAAVESALDDPEGVGRVLARALEEERLALAVISPGGEVIASTAPDDGPPCWPPPGFDPRTGLPPPGPPPRPGLGPPCRAAPLLFPDGAAGRIELYPERRAPASPFSLSVIALVLVVVGLSSWLLARSIAAPLRHLSRAAHAFGAGDLDARARVDRRDELGDVARAFDDMAARVNEILRAERELVANVSHELRTPLARIRVALDLAAEGDAQVARESLADITEDLDELQRLISDVLAAARLELGDGVTTGGIPPLRRERLDIAALLDHAAERFRGAHAERELRVDVAPDLPPVDGDPVLLRRVVDNLLENAHQYSSVPRDAVRLSARAEDAVVIEVRDDGVGMTRDELGRVFRPFFRADSSRTRATGGIGLGLALARRIVAAHGGTIAIESEPGKGTLARVRLPATTASTDLRTPRA